MDRSTVRIILIILGALVLAGVYLWPLYRERVQAWWSGRPRKRGFLDDMPQGAFSEHDGPASEKAYDDDYLDDDLPPMPAARVREPYWAEEEEDAPLQPAPAAAHPRPAEPAARKPLPQVVQLSVVAVDDAFFTGGELEDTFNYVGLRYGDMGIFHLYNAEGEILFSVASMVEPGTFPVNDMMNFECPGVVLFFQSNQVDDPLDVFDTLVTCCHELAIRLNGVEWDAERRPLTTGKIVAMRQSLQP